MREARATRKRSGRNKSSRYRDGNPPRSALDHAVVLIDTVCCLAGDEQLIGNQSNPEIKQLRRAIEDHDTPFLFEQLMEAFSLQGISDHAAYTYMERHGRLTWRDLERATAKTPVCSKLKSYWAFCDCRFHKSSRTCANQEILSECSLPRHDQRNGRLNQTGYSLFMFIRDVADGDLVGWIDNRLEQSIEGSIRGRALRMRNALVQPLCNTYGVSDKLANMTLAWLLTSSPPSKPLWLEAGASMIAIDTLVHNFLHRTGIMRRFDAEHAYGPACYEVNGCAEIIARVAARIDAREFCRAFPKVFPRFFQHGIWRWCSQGGLAICNGVSIDDRHRCDNKGCPLFDLCDRVALHDVEPSG